MNYYTHHELAKAIEASLFNGLNAPETMPPCDRLQASYATLLNLHAQIGIDRAISAKDRQGVSQALCRAHKYVGWITLGYHHHTSVAYEVGRCCVALVRLKDRTDPETLTRITECGSDITKMLKASKGIDGALERTTELAATWIRAELQAVNVDPAEYRPAKGSDLTYGDPSVPLRFDLPVL